MKVFGMYSRLLLKRVKTQNILGKYSNLCSTIFAFGIVFHNAASSLGDLSSCNSVDITKNLSFTTLAA